MVLHQNTHGSLGVKYFSVRPQISDEMAHIPYRAVREINQHPLLIIR
jgi:hypothetical protein